MKIKIVSDNGVVKQGRAELERLFKSLDGEYLIDVLPLSNPHSIDDWRHLYFHLRDLLHSEADTGYTKLELHDLIKNEIIPKLWKEWKVEDRPWIDPAVVATVNEPVSTRYLTQAGWKEFVTRFKEYAQTNFEIYI